MVRTAALAACLVYSTPAGAEDFYGFTLRAPEVEALTLLRNYGTPAKMRDLGDGFESWFAGEYVVSFCKGRLWGASRKMGVNFEAFARAAELATSRYGPAKPVSSYRDGDKPVAVVKLVWSTPDFPRYELAYYQVEGKPALANEQATVGGTCK